MRHSVLFLILLWTALGLSGCNNTEPDPPVVSSGSTSYLALGDSYTIGESVAESERWPVLLAEALREQGAEVEDPEIVARTGWTTRNLLDAMDDRELTPTYDLVSVLIGVNNQYQGRSLAEYRQEYSTVLQRAIDLVGGDPRRVFVLSIPDYGYTPFGASNQAAISEAIDEFNAACREITEAAGVAFYDITPISREGLDRPALVADDGLHPSGVQYAEWVATLRDRVLALI